MVILFFGGWLPIIDSLFFIPGWIWFSGKLLFFMYIFVWIRGTLPRYRFDQLMFLGWKVILPLSLALVFLTFSLIEFFWFFDMEINYVIIWTFFFILFNWMLIKIKLP